MKAMEKNPADRFLSYDEFQMSFEAARTYLLLQSQQPGPKKPKSTTSWWKKKTT
jgi:hypothetical protein